MKYLSDKLNLDEIELFKEIINECACYGIVEKEIAKFLVIINYALNFDEIKEQQK